MKKYESPKMSFETLKLEQAILGNVCWGYANRSDDKCYFNTSGKGYIRFSVDGKSCKDTSVLTCKIEDVSTIPSNLLDAAEKEFKEWWDENVANGHSNFKGSNYAEDPTGWS